MIPIDYYLIVGAILFAIGTIGVFLRRNAIVIFMCIELMLNAVNLTLVALSTKFNSLDGQIMVFLVMTVAAAEAAIGLAIIVTIFRNKNTVNLEEINLMKW